MKLEIVRSFNDLVAYLDKYRYAIVNISANWCKPCKEIKPNIEKFVSVINNDKFVYLKIDYDIYESDDNFDKIFSTTGIPYFGIIKDNLLVHAVTSGDFIRVSTMIHQYIQHEEEVAKKLDLSNDF